MTQTKLKCNKCNYEWTTKSKLMKVCCPSCGYKVNNAVPGVDNDK